MNYFISGGVLMSNNEKDFEIVEGDGSGIEMTPVSDYIVSIKPQQKNKAKNIVVPQEKKINKKKKK